MFARKRRQKLDQAEQGDQRPHTNHKESGAPAKILPDDAANGQPEHHRQGGTGGQQAQGLGAFTGRGQADRQRGGDRPENRVGKGNADAANHQHREVPGQKREHVAGNEEHEEADQQLTPLHLAGEQHKGQRHHCHHPGVDGEHDPHLRGLHAETAGDIREQANGHKFSGIKDKGGNGERNHP